MIAQGVAVIACSVWLHGCGSGGEWNVESEGESVEVDRHLSIGCLEHGRNIRFSPIGDKFCRSDGVTTSNPYCPGSGCCKESRGCECHTCESTGFTFTPGACAHDPEPNYDYWAVAKCSPPPTKPSKPIIKPAPVPVSPSPAPQPGCATARRTIRFQVRSGKFFCRSDGETRGNNYCPGSGCCKDAQNCELTCGTSQFGFTPGACPSPNPNSIPSPISSPSCDALEDKKSKKWCARQGRRYKNKGKNGKKKVKFFCQTKKAQDKCSQSCCEAVER